MKYKFFWFIFISASYTIVRQVLHCNLGGDKLSEINELLKKIRDDLNISLREAARRSKLSHSYIDFVEKGVHLKRKARIKPSPDTLKALSEAYHYDYTKLMQVAGYVDKEDIEKESVNALPESVILDVIEKAEKEFGVSLRDDPDVEEAVRNMITTLAKMKQQGSQKTD